VCVCVSVTLSVNSPTGQTLQRIFTVDSLKDTKPNWQPERKKSSYYYYLARCCFDWQRLLEFDTIDFIESRQIRLCRFSRVQTGNKVERMFGIQATNISNFWQSRPSWKCSTLATTSTTNRRRSTFHKTAKDWRQISDEVESRQLCGLSTSSPVV